ncbi:MAG TPA: response regulator transcription factor [Chloroflexia bacterium]|nr:response regulator transcription factor [Chloroflexia bacterium]
MIRLLICEDQTLMRQGLVTILGLEPGIVVVGEAGNGQEAVDRVAELQPDVVLMDVQMPVMGGVEATRIIAAQYPNSRVVILTTFDYEEYVFEGVKAGAMGYMLKDTPAPELVRTIKRVHEGERFIQPAVASKILFEFATTKHKPTEEAGYEPLSEREIDIISRLAQGMSNREIADDLALAEGTVKNYVSTILSKLHAANRVQAINLARQHKII